MMFPEGHRYPDDEVHDFMPGVGMIALRSGAPVVPVVSKGTPAIWRDGRPGLPAFYTCFRISHFRNGDLPAR